MDGVTQQPIDGASLLATFDDPATPSCTNAVLRDDGLAFDLPRGLEGDHRPRRSVSWTRSGSPGSRDFDEDHWDLFDLSADFSESTDLADEHPEVVGELEELWFEEAERNHVLPISDRLVDRFGGFIPPIWPAGTTRTFLPGGGPGRRIRPGHWRGGARGGEARGLDSAVGSLRATRGTS